MRSIRLLATCLVLLFAACGANTQEPHVIADELFTAVADGDNDTWRALHATDAVVVFPDGGTIPLFGASQFIVDDFDGDGVTSIADDFQFRNALHDPAGQEMSWECASISEAVAECSVTATDAFVRAGGADPLQSRSRITVEGGLITTEEFLESPDPAGMERANAAHSETMTTYQEWIRDTHPDRYSALFHGPCCRAQLVGLPGAITEHMMLMEEFFTASE